MDGFEFVDSELLVLGRFHWKMWVGDRILFSSSAMSPGVGVTQKKEERQISSLLENEVHH